MMLVIIALVAPIFMTSLCLFQVVTVQLSSIMEMDSNNDPVTNHSIESFADLNFTMDSSMTEEMYFNLSAKKLSLETNLMGSAKLMVICYLCTAKNQNSGNFNDHLSAPTNEFYCF